MNGAQRSECRVKGPVMYWDQWEMGDIVSRDGTDEHEIIDISEPEKRWELDVMTVRCIKEPVPFDDGRIWARIGEEESNTLCRYRFVRKGEQHNAAHHLPERSVAE